MFVLYLELYKNDEIWQILLLHCSETHTFAYW
jgi:hypothetical protein